MCHKIEASFVLIHVLRNNAYCTISEIVKKKFMIEERIPSVFVDVSRNSILSSVEYFPEIFEFRDNKILKRENSDVFFDEPIIEYFDHIEVNDSLKQEITQLLE